MFEDRWAHVSGSWTEVPGSEVSSEPRMLLPQVSFYRGSLPVEVPAEAEAARQRKGTDALWMATLPIKLPVRLQRLQLTRGDSPRVTKDKRMGPSFLYPCLLTETPGCPGEWAGD
jgi:hypothetical protein